MDSNTLFQEAGLVDTAGKPTTPTNWGQAAEPDRDAIDWGDAGMESEETPAQKEVTPAAATPEPAAPQTFDPNPAPRPQITPQQAHAYGLNTINQQFQEALIHGLSIRDADGKSVYTVDQLAAQFQPIRQAMEAQLQADVVKHQMAPYAQRMAAEHIAKTHGIKVDDILDGSSPEVMEDRARTIARLQRDSKFQTRVNNKVDVAEGSRNSSNTITAAYERLSPQQKIKYGLLRGDN